MKRIYSQHWSDYELIDAGKNKKLERWGKIITIRPERNAYFSPILPSNEWNQKAHYEFLEETTNTGIWKSLKEDYPLELNNKMANWQISYKNCLFNLQLTKFKHLGVFPEQQTNWNFIKDHLKEGHKFLNLFAYTGAASLIANSVGADVFIVIR